MWLLSLLALLWGVAATSMQDTEVQPDGALANAGPNPNLRGSELGPESEPRKLVGNGNGNSASEDGEPTPTPTSTPGSSVVTCGGEFEYAICVNNCGNNCEQVTVPAMGITGQTSLLSAASTQLTHHSHCLLLLSLIF
ncbi:unnamed protein product, partial [Chrysoparadoxa australica]